MPDYREHLGQAARQERDNKLKFERAGMLTFGFRKGESAVVVMDGKIVGRVTYCKNSRPCRAVLGFEFPKHIKIVRQSLIDKVGGIERTILAKER